MPDSTKSCKSHKLTLFFRSHAQNDNWLWYMRVEKWLEKKIKQKM